MKGICFIPARGGSKRVPQKNIKPFNGSNFLEMTIKTVIESHSFDKIIVTSDDDQILEIASKYREITTHKRLPELSDDKATVFSVFKSLLEEFSGYDFLAGVLVTAPFKKSSHLKEAVELYKQHKGESNIISVTSFDYPPQFGFKMENKELEMLFPEAFNRTTNSKFMDPFYHNNGVIWVGDVQRYLQNGTFYKGKLLGYEMDHFSSMDIDYPFQFEVAEILAKKPELFK